MIRKRYPSDVSEDEWALVTPYLTLLPEGAAQREHPIREVFNGLRHVAKIGAPWRWMPNDLPPWAAVYQQARRWLAAGCFEELAADLRAIGARRKFREVIIHLDNKGLLLPIVVQKRFSKNLNWSYTRNIRLRWPP